MILRASHLAKLLILMICRLLSFYFILMYSILSSMNNDNFASSFSCLISFISFVCLVLARTRRTTLNRSGHSIFSGEILKIFLILKEILDFNISLFNVMFDINFC